MKTLSDYKVIPRMLKSSEKQTISLIPRDPSRKFDDALEYNVAVTPLECYTDMPDELLAQYKYKVTPKNGVISFECTLFDEQEWQITVWTSDVKKANIFHVISLFEDLYERIPLKGDLHLHSCRSDGTHTPATVAANYRKYGFDFISLTDHSNWHGSDEMIKSYEDVPLGMTLLHGEEIHIKTPKEGPIFGSGNIHLVNVGGDASVTDLYNSDPERYNEEIRRAAKELDLPNGVDKLQFAHRKWIADRSRECGGLAILPHAFWLCGPGNYLGEDTSHRKFRFYHVNLKMLDALIENEVFDAYEMLSGGSLDLGVHENDMQTAFYYDQMAKGRKIRIVGSSDCHRTEPPVLFNVAHTVVFAKNNTKDGIIEAIKDGYSAAVETYADECARVHGSYRMVRLVRFLMSYYFPEHDELCFEEGILMREYASGDISIKDELASKCRRVKNFANYTLKGK